MGADLVFNAIWARQDRTIDFETLRLAVDVPRDEDYTDDEEQDATLDDVNELETQWNGNNDRSTSYFFVGPYKILITGGTSWGDSPSEFFDSLQRLWGLPNEALEKAGFFVE